MRIAYFDAFSGASGDMILGALLDAGLPLDTLEAELAKLRLPGWTISLGRRVRAGISAADFEVRCEESAPERGFTEIARIIEESSLDPVIKDRSIAVFRRLGEAEARVHDTTIEKIHFHEVGAIDCIIDICGACAGIQRLGIDRIVASPLPQGHGFVRCAHGRMPIPTPATLELLRGCPTYSIDVEGELVTPTGAALLSTLADEWGPLPPMRPEAIGYGSGKKEFGGRPNLLRLVVGASTAAEGADSRPDHVVVLEANIDDMNPEGYEWTLERLFAAGALDAWLAPIQMKKGRPGVLLSVIAPPERESELARVILRETTSFGVRSSVWHRHILEREIRAVETVYGPVQVKIGRQGTDISIASPEYGDCRRIAEATGTPLKEIYRAAIVAADTLFGSSSAAAPDLMKGGDTTGRRSA